MWQSPPNLDSLILALSQLKAVIVCVYKFIFQFISSDSGVNGVFGSGTSCIEGCEEWQS